MKCLICGSSIEFDYDEVECGWCSQMYEYEEGLMIKLTDRQLELLRADNKG